ncbi:11866_t:CDS:2, partial [Funneliformis caledonium]
DSSPVPANNPTSAQNQQELSANSLPSGQDCLRVQELFRKSPEKGIRWEIDDIDIGVDLQPKLPTLYNYSHFKYLMFQEIKLYNG